MASVLTFYDFTIILTNDNSITCFIEQQSVYCYTVLISCLPPNPSVHRITYNAKRVQQLVLCTCALDWIEQGLTSPPTQYRLSGRQFYRRKDPTNSIKVLKEKLASQRPEEAQNQGTSVPHEITPASIQHVSCSLKHTSSSFLFPSTRLIHLYSRLAVCRQH